MKIGCITPTRGDRPEFLERCKLYVARQTIQATHYIVDDPPADPNVRDIGLRVRTGIQRAKKDGCDVVAVIEDDDWYSSTYLEQQIRDWSKAGCPLLWGVKQTIYYHVGIRKWSRLDHTIRSSLCAMLIRTDVIDKYKWEDDCVYLDMKLWATIYKARPDLRQLSNGPAEKRFVGIKHGTGLCGGAGHRESYRYQYSDYDGRWLKSVVGPDDYPFYESLYENKPPVNSKSACTMIRA